MSKYCKDDKVIEIIALKPYKNKVLLIGDKNHSWKVATFRSDVCAKEFEKYLDEFLDEGKKDDKC